jgi:hypothetical protein
MTNGLIIAMNVNYQKLCLKANQDLGKFFDCPVNSKYHIGKQKYE